LIDDAVAEITIVFDLAAQFLDRQLGNRVCGVNRARALSTTSSAMPMSSRYFSC
jgi:hypothetical protein